MRNKLLGLSMLVSTVLVAVWRWFALPAVVGSGTTLTHVNYPLLLLMAVVTVVLLVLGRARYEYASPALNSRVLSVCGALFGTVLFASSLWDIVQFMWEGVTPAPFAHLVSGADRILLTVSLTAGFLGGLFLAVWFTGLFLSPKRPFRRWGRLTLAVGGILTGALIFLLFSKSYQTDIYAMDVAGVAVGDIQRMKAILPLAVASVVGVAISITAVRAAKKHTFSEAWMWLLLPLWAFARLARYNVVFASSVDISSAVYEFFLYALILLFLLEAAKYLADVQPPSRHLRGIAAATAVLCVAASASRLALFIAGQTAAVAYCSIPSVVEAALGAFAAAVALTLKEAVPRHSKG